MERRLWSWRWLGLRSQLRLLVSHTRRRARMVSEYFQLPSFLRSGTGHLYPEVIQDECTHRLLRECVQFLPRSSSHRHPFELASRVVAWCVGTDTHRHLHRRFSGDESFTSSVDSADAGLSLGIVVRSRRESTTTKPTLSSRGKL